MQIIIDTEKPMSAADLKILEALVLELLQGYRPNFPTQAERHTASAPAEEEAPAKKTAAKKTAASRKPTSEEPPAPTEAPAPEKAAKSEKADSGLTLDDVKARVQVLMDNDRRNDVVAALASVGAKRVSLLPEDKFQQFLDELAD